MNSEVGRAKLQLYCHFPHAEDFFPKGSIDFTSFVASCGGLWLDEPKAKNLTCFVTVFLFTHIKLKVLARFQLKTNIPTASAK